MDDRVYDLEKSINGFLKEIDQFSLHGPISSRRIFQELQQQVHTLCAPYVARVRLIEMQGEIPGELQRDVEEVDHAGVTLTRDVDMLLEGGKLLGDGSLEGEVDEGLVTGEHKGIEAAVDEPAGDEPTGEEATGEEDTDEEDTDEEVNDLPGRSSSSYRLAALKATEKFRDQLLRSSSDKRSKRPKRGSNKPSAKVVWLIPRLGTESALESALDLANNSTWIAEDALRGHGSIEFLPSRATGDMRLQGLYSFVSLSQSISADPIRAHYYTVERQLFQAHFHWVYRAAVNDAGEGENSTFFRLSDELLQQSGVAPIRKHAKNYCNASAVLDRLTDLIFSSPEPPKISRKQCRQRLHRANKDGKRWARIIITLGYKGVLLMSPDVSDNRMYLTHAEMDILLPAWKHKLENMEETCVSKFQQAFQDTFMPMVHKHAENFRRFVPRFEWPIGQVLETRDLPARHEYQDSPSSTSPGNDDYAVSSRDNALDDSMEFLMSWSSDVLSSTSSDPCALEDSPPLGFPVAGFDRLSDIWMVFPGVRRSLQKSRRCPRSINFSDKPRQ